MRGVVTVVVLEEAPFCGPLDMRVSVLPFLLSVPGCEFLPGAFCGCFDFLYAPIGLG